MNRLALFIIAAASLCPAAPAARGDRASLSLRSGSVSISVDAGQRPSAAAASIDLAPDPEPNPFVPDVYPSVHDAARGAGERWARQAAERWRDPPARVRVVCEDDRHLFVPVAEGLRGRLRGVRVDGGDGRHRAAGEPPADEAWLYVTRTGTGVSIRSSGASDATAEARYVEKPWVANFNAFAAGRPGRWLVAWSDPDSPAGSPEDAAREARAKAWKQLGDLVVARMGDARRYGRGDIGRVVETHLMGDRLVVDRFPQKFERPYGNLYREAVLVDASDRQLDTLVGDVRRTLRSERQSRLGGLASAGAVLLVTYALYRFANAFTRGYFTWSLRTAAAVVAAGAVTLLAAL